MQTHVSWSIKVLLVAIVLSTFGFVTPTVVHAVASVPVPSHASAMGETSGQTSLGCYQQGCVQEHSTCQRHCVRESEDQTVVVAFTPTHIDPILVFSTPQGDTVDVFTHTSISTTTPDRTPPTHKLLRSVMKRE